MDKGVLIIGGVTVLVLGAIMAIAMNDPAAKQAASFQGTDAEVVSEKPVHFHPNLQISINGEKQEIPANLGVTPTSMGEIHTHDSTGELHYESSLAPVKKGHLKLARFFEVWGKSFNSNQILDTKKAEGDKLVMLVNGSEVTDYENYIVKDGDKIEIRFDGKRAS